MSGGRFVRLPRVYPIVDAEVLAARRADPVAVAEWLLEAGAEILQLRSKSFLSASLFEQAERIAALCRDAGATFVINDRADVAKLVNAGLHVGQDDLPPQAARAVVGEAALMGYSTHNEEQFAKGLAEPVNYLAFGPIYATSSKVRPDPVVGTLRLSRLRHTTSRSIVAIGGITRANAAEVLASGADSVAVISDLYPDPCVKASVQERFKEWQQTVGL